MNRADRRGGVDVRHSRRGATAVDRRRPILYASLAVLAVAVVVAVGFASHVPKSASEAPSYTALKVGDPAPPFSAATTSGPFDSTKVGNRPILLEVFATWCPHCQAEVGTLNDLYKTYGGRVAFVAVSGSDRGLDGSTPESQADVLDFAQRFGVRYPVAFDPQLDVAKKYLQGGYPTLVVIDRQGKIARIGSGEEPKSELEAAIEKAIRT
jgi:thiol-disulfide isomerase/thioredoxin